jgi:ubiquinone/menaquinone biosynthesis C-methylase UbiE
LSQEDLRAVYDQRAREYQYQGPQGPPSRKQRGILQHLHGLAGLRLLEVGCGDGPYLAAASHEDATVIAGVDISPLILREARQRVRREGRPDTVRLAAADAVALPLADASFDRLLATQVIEHVPRHEAALREMRRVLRPGSELVISTDHRDNRVTQALGWPARTVRRMLGRAEHHPAFLHRSYTRSGFLTLVRSAGFEVLEASTYRFSWPASLGKLRPLVRMLDAVEEHLIRHRPWSAWGDILLVVARRAT